MNLDNAKKFLETFLSKPQVALTIILTGLPALAGTAYISITKYNEAVSAIEDVQDSKKSIGELKRQVAALTLTAENLRERNAALSDSIIRSQEKSSDAIALARETKAIAEGTGKEVKAALHSVRSEIEATNMALRNEMAVLRKATVNPLGR